MQLFPPGVRRALRLPSTADRLARELDDEMRFHMDMRVAELVAGGMSEDAARAEALRRFGDANDLREYCESMEVSHMHRMRAMEWWDGWVQDVRFALRQIVRSPAFFAVAAFTLALGIAATTSIFSVVRGVLLRPLPYPDPDRIVQVWQVGEGGGHGNFSTANYEDLRERSRSFSALAEYSATGPISVSGMADPVRSRAAFVSREFFDVLEVRPLRGRLFAPEETEGNAARVMLVSYGFWQRQLGGAESAIGRTLNFDNEPFTVIGVMPPTVDYPVEVELWLPRELQPTFPSRTAHNWQVLGRLGEGVTLPRARQEASAIARALKQQYGSDTWMSDAAIVPLQEHIVGRTKGTLMVLLAGSLVLLLIGCANVVNLLIARMAGRQAEVALRVALGAGRRRLVQQCLAEALTLSLAAALLGLGLAAAGVKLLLVLQPGNLPRIGEVRMDMQVLAFAVLVATLAALAMGIITAWRGTRGELREALSQSQRTQGGATSSERVRRTLVVAQVAMAVVLLVGAGLFAHSFMRLLSVNPGFGAERKLVIEISDGGRPAARVQFYDDLLARFRAIPGVAQAGGVNVIPLGGASAGNGTFIILNSIDEKLAMEDMSRLMSDPQRTGSAEFRVAGPGYFDAMGIPLQRGRIFDDRDDGMAPHAAVISASLARTRWAGDDPIGKAIQFGNMDGVLTPFTIVGVVGDVREASLASAPRPTFYVSYRQRPLQAWRFNFVLATAGDPVSLINTARRILRDARPDLPPRIRTVDAIVSGSVADRRFVLSLVAVFGAAALLLSALGIYSVISYLVAQRSRELSIRVALGAQSRDVVALVLREGIGLAAIGIVVGALISVGVSRLVENMLFGVTPTDPAAFALVVLVLALVAGLASWFPARRAARVQAMDVLRVG